MTTAVIWASFDHLPVSTRSMWDPVLKQASILLFALLFISSRYARASNIPPEISRWCLTHGCRQPGSPHPSCATAKCEEIKIIGLLVRGPPCRRCCHICCIAVNDDFRTVQTLYIKITSTCVPSNRREHRLSEGTH
jgi:hypothetical protein